MFYFPNNDQSGSNKHYFPWLFGGFLGYVFMVYHQQKLTTQDKTWDQDRLNSIGNSSWIGYVYELLIKKRITGKGTGDMTTSVSTSSELSSCIDVNSPPTPETQIIYNETMLVPGGPSPINLINDETLSYYLKSVALNDSSWREDPVLIDDKDKDTPDSWVPRHPDLIRLTGRHPFNCEAPLQKLVKKGFITPTSLHYVRNHGPPPHIEWGKHRIHVTGLCPQPLELSMNDLLTKFPTRSLPVTLVCCGNRRKEQNMIKQTIGFNWGAAGVSNGVWTGVRLCDILRLAGLNTMTPGLHVRFASETAKGGDKLPGGTYGTSVPIERAMDPAYDIILAFLYNGELLQPDHGFPVRLIVPGYIGGRMIKWITDITIMNTESQDYYHYYDNRVLPSHVDAETSKKEDWWHRPEYICNDLSVNSAIAVPDHNETVSVDTTNPGTYTLEGYAYTGGGRRITRVEFSLDGGHSWTITKLNKGERPTEYGKHWCWLFWSFDLPLAQLLPSNVYEICLRAWDESHNTQPMKPTWNVMGMLNNPWFRVKVHRIPSGDGSGNVTIQFEHPTLAGAQEGGWMAKLKGRPSLTTPWIPHEQELINGMSAVTVKGSMTVVDKAEGMDKGTVAAASNDESHLPLISMQEVKKHVTEESAWIVVKGKVYDCSPFLKAHPGGADSIMLNAGTECTEEFGAIHSEKAWGMLDKYCIGRVAANEEEAASSPMPTNSSTADEKGVSVVAASVSGDLIALDQKRRIPFQLMEREMLSHDSLRLRFALQSPKHILGLPVGQHMFFYATIDGKLVMRAYTPTTSDHEVGYFDLVIKVYGPCPPTFPEGGKMSQYLGRLAVGDSIDVKGPLGHVHYQGSGLITVNHIDFKVSKFAMLCGGTGITPIFQIIKAILRNADDRTEIFLLYGNRTIDDILLHKELNELAVSHPNQLHIKHVISRATSQQQQLQNGPPSENIIIQKDMVFQRMDPSLIKHFIPSGNGLKDGEADASMALLCGPQTLLDEVCVPTLHALGYPEEKCVFF